MGCEEKSFLLKCARDFSHTKKETPEIRRPRGRWTSKDFCGEEEGLAGEGVTLLS